MRMATSQTCARATAQVAGLSEAPGVRILDEPSPLRCPLAHWGGERFVAELKRVPSGRRTLAEVRKEGVAQLAGYLDTLGLAEGWLLVFDQTPGRTWKQRCWRREVRVGDMRLHLRGA